MRRDARCRCASTARQSGIAMRTDAIISQPSTNCCLALVLFSGAKGAEQKGPPMNHAAQKNAHQPHRGPPPSTSSSLFNPLPQKTPQLFKQPLHKTASPHASTPVPPHPAHLFLHPSHFRVFRGSLFHPLGFSVDIAPADEIRPNSAEGRFIDAGGRETPCAVLAGDLRGARRTRSQGASVETNVDQALDAVVCVPNGSMDVDGRPGISADESRSDPG